MHGGLLRAFDVRATRFRCKCAQLPQRSIQLKLRCDRCSSSFTLDLTWRTGPGRGPWYSPPAVMHNTASNAYEAHAPALKEMGGGKEKSLQARACMHMGMPDEKRGAGGQRTGWDPHIMPHISRLFDHPGTPLAPCLARPEPSRARAAAG